MASILNIQAQHSIIDMSTIKKISGSEDWRRFSDLLQQAPQASFVHHPDWLEGYLLIPLLIQKSGYLFYDDSGLLVGGIAGIRYWQGQWNYVFPSDPFGTNADEALKISWLKLLRQTTKGKIYLSSALQGIEDAGFKRGSFPRKIYPDPGIGRIQVLATEEEQLANFKYQVKRNVRRALEQGLESERISSPAQLKEFYQICKLNADQGGYVIRPYLFYHRMWKRGLRRGNFHFILARHQGKLKGGIWLIQSGGMLHNIMGGSVKEKPRLEVGYFMQWSAIKLSMALGCSAYNISVGGTSGVEAFKDDFGREVINRTKTYISES